MRVETFITLLLNFLRILPATSLDLPLSTLMIVSPTLPPEVFRLIWYALVKTDFSSFALLLCSDDRGIWIFVARDMLLVFGFFTSSSIILRLVSSTKVKKPLTLKSFIPLLVIVEASSVFLVLLGDTLSHTIYNIRVYI